MVMNASTTFIAGYMVGTLVMAIISRQLTRSESKGVRLIYSMIIFSLILVFAVFAFRNFN